MGKIFFEDALKQMYIQFNSIQKHFIAIQNIYTYGLVQNEITVHMNNGV